MRADANKNKNAVSFSRTLSLIYHQTVYNVRKTHRNPMIGLLLNIAQTLVMLGGFYLMMTIMNRYGSWQPGDFVLYLLSGIFIFMVHVKTVGAVSSATGPSSPMALHRPLNILVVIAGAAISSFYLQFISVCILLFLYHAIITPVSINDPAAVMAMLVLSWFFGISVGMLFYATKVWMPNFSGMASSAYSRVNMIASGKMFLANSLPMAILPLFAWNPLFHIIDQTRGYMFINYVPRNSSVFYPFFASLALLIIAFMLVYFARKYSSLSWGAAR